MRNLTMTLFAVLLSVGIASGQSYYDDDIYYDASKDKKQKVDKKQKSEQEPVVQEEPEIFDAPQYEVYNTNPRDVDEYNRRGGIYAPDPIATEVTDSISDDVFEYTERIERFSNPDIVKNSDDEELKELYYADEVNIIIGTPSTYVTFDDFGMSLGWASPYYGWHYPYYSRYYWGWSWYDPWYYPYSWGWSYPHYHPWCPAPYYGPGHHHAYFPTRYTPGGRRPYGGTSGQHYAAGSRMPKSNVGYNSSRTTGRLPSAGTYTGATRSNKYKSQTNSYSTGKTYSGYRGSSSTNRSEVNVRKNDSQYSGFSRDNTTRRRNTSTYDNSYRRQSTSSYRGNSRGSYNRGSSSGGGRGSFGGGGRSSGGGSRGGRR